MRGYVARARPATRRLWHACHERCGVEYGLEERERVEGEAAALIAKRSVMRSQETGAHVSTLCIFPTPDSNVYCEVHDSLDGGWLARFGLRASGPA